MKRRKLEFTSLTAFLLLTAANAVYGQATSQITRPGQTTITDARPEQIVLSLIRSHPVTAPYPIATSWQRGKVVLYGAVGTKQVHDVAVRLAIETGIPFRDDLVIDTGTAHMVAQAQSATGAAVSPGGYPGTQSAGYPGVQMNGSTYPYVYPEPLLGYLDDPFFGMVPPIISYPPWWSRGRQNGGMIPNQNQMPNQPANAPITTAPELAQTNGLAPQGGAPVSGWRQLQVDSVKGQVDIHVDITGQVFLRGSVISEQVAREVEDAVRAVPGVTAVYGRLNVIAQPVASDKPPPPPVPMMVEPARVPEPAAPLTHPDPKIAPARPKAAPAPTAPAALDSQELTQRVLKSLERQPVAAALPVKVRSNDGAVTLAGRVPSAYEAMLAYRAAQQTPGVREIIDRLEFAVPDEDHPNPLVRMGRPEDVEPYLASQIRRHIGDLAHIDRVEAKGDELDLRGTIQHAADKDRLMAILRSISVLHGFRLETDFKSQ